jgi:hypothetical protein
MNRLLVSSSTLAVAELFPDAGRKHSTLRDLLLVLGCLGALSVGLLLWAAFIRKPRRHSSGHSHHSHDLSRTAAAAEPGSQPHRRRHRHRRRRRGSHYPQNPTLAQTGGLPPVRRDEPPASPQQTGTQPP